MCLPGEVNQKANNSLGGWETIPLIFVHIFRTPLGKITNRHIPLSVFGLTFILWALGAVEGSYCTMFGTGLIVSWVYLRFYQVVLKIEEDPEVNTEFRCTAMGLRATWLIVLPSPPCSQMFFNPL